MPLSDKTLILIDFQKGFDDPFWSNRNNPDTEENASALMTAMRAAGGRLSMSAT